MACSDYSYGYYNDVSGSCSAFNNILNTRCSCVPTDISGNAIADISGNAITDISGNNVPVEITIKVPSGKTVDINIRLTQR